MSPVNQDLKAKLPAIAGVIVVTAALAFAFRGALAPSGAGPGAAAPTPAPARTISAKERNGTTRNLVAPTRRIVVVHFWATWCAPCVEEFPGMLATWKKLKSRDDIELVTVSVDDEWKTVDRWLAKQKASDVPTLLDPTRSAAKAFGTEKFPETWILGPDGEVLAHVQGPMDWTDPRVMRQLEEFAAALPRRT